MRALALPVWSRTLLFTLLVPGSVLGLGPWLMLRSIPRALSAAAMIGTAGTSGLRNRGGRRDRRRARDLRVVRVGFRGAWPRDAGAMGCAAPPRRGRPLSPRAQPDVRRRAARARRRGGALPLDAARDLRRGVRAHVPPARRAGTRSRRSPAPSATSSPATARTSRAGCRACGGGRSLGDLVLEGMGDLVRRDLLVNFNHRHALTPQAGGA